jgi:hypothetical protein
MQHTVSPVALERAPPTLWPLIPQYDTQMALALEACEVENRRLRTLVIRLAEVILRITGAPNGYQP